MSQWEPLDNSEWIEPGIASTSRPAQRKARCEDPLRSAAHYQQPRAKPLLGCAGKVGGERRCFERELGDGCTVCG
jgi:hypothetical protein